MKITAIVQLIYGLLTIIGGIIGYVNAKSTTSLIMGVLFGIGLLISSYLIMRSNFTGVYISLVLSLILTIVFAIRFTKSLKLMPAGIMLLLSLISLGFSIYSLTNKESFLP